MTRVRRSLVVLAALVAAALVVVPAAVRVDATSAAWTDSAFLTSSASSGTWTAPSANTCTVVTSSTGATTTKACTVTSVTVDTPWGTTGSRQTNLYVYVNAPTIDHSVERIVLKLNLSTIVTTSPAWSWSTSAIGAGNLDSSRPYTCAMPSVTVYTNQWAHPSYYIPLYENKSAASTPFVC